MSDPTMDDVARIAAGLLPKECSPIWGYAKKMKKSLQKILPTEGYVRMSNGLEVNMVVTTQQEAEALRETIRHLGQFLPAHRIMVPGDIGAHKPEPSWRDELEKAFGPVAVRAHLKGQEQ